MGSGYLHLIFNLVDLLSFVFLEELAEPLEEAPRFLKASKLDLAEQRKKTPPTNNFQKKLVPKPKLARASKASA